MSFLQAFAIVIGEEGVFTADADDAGDWTGGACGVGVCAGTKYGISAAAYPALNIRNLTLADAQAIYRRDYWLVVADELPPGLALVVFDAAVNSGVYRAACWLQSAAGVVQDGDIGPQTLAAVAASSAQALAIEVTALRIEFLAALPAWHLYSIGWARRLAALPYHAASMTD